MKSFAFSSIFGSLVANIDKTRFFETQSVYIKAIREGILSLYDNREGVKKSNDNLQPFNFPEWVSLKIANVKIFVHIFSPFLDFYTRIIGAPKPSLTDRLEYIPAL